MSLKEKIANILDLLADAGGVLPEPTPETPTSDDPIAKFAATYHELTGEDLTPALRAQLEGNEDLRNAILKVSARAPERPTPLGEAADSVTNPDERPESKEAAVQRAYDRFAQNITAIGQR